jgi:alpha-methylacyl-CoA racemase
VVTEDDAGDGPLRGVRVLDLSALGPGPFCSMLLADFAADVIAVERPDAPPLDPATFFSRGKRSAVVDLRSPGGAEVVARLADRADVLLESNRPGTMERRGLGPDDLCARNPRLIYARLTGWGQEGPYRSRVGHDVNYLGISGALGVLGGDEPAPPLAMLGDLAGGSMFAFAGIVMALLERSRTGCGQVVDASIVDGSALLNTPQLGEYNAGVWPGRGRGLLSGVAPFYGVYRCADGRLFAVGAIEPRFYAEFLAALRLTAEGSRVEQVDAATWPDMRRRVAERFAEHDRQHWTAIFAGIDGCGTPVLELDELADDPHLRERGTVIEHDDGIAAAPAPRLSASPGRLRPRPTGRGSETRGVLREAGFADDEIAALVAARTVRVPDGEAT